MKMSPVNLIEVKSKIAALGIICCILLSFSCDTSSGTFFINNDDAYTTSLNVVLTMNGEQNPTQMRFSNDNKTFSAWEKYAVTKTWKLDTAQGMKTVYAEFKDSRNNVYKRTDTIDLVLSPVFNKLFGGALNDYAKDVQQTKDGGYIVAGFTESAGAGMGDVWLIKTDSNGSKLWEKTFGDVYFEMGLTVQQDNDGGYVLAGGTIGSGMSTDRALVIKTDLNGNKVWSKTFDGSMVEELRQTADGGYIVAGCIYSASNGTNDGWIAKIDRNGNRIWDKIFGGNAGSDVIHAVQFTADGGYIFAGNTCLSAADTEGQEAWMIRTDASGNKIWEKTFGGLSAAWAVHQTSDGGYVLAGNIFTDNDMYDGWLIRTDADGNKLWDKIFGGNQRNTDLVNALQITPDGGFILAGSTVESGATYGQAWLIRADSNGNKVWDKTFGGTGKETVVAQAVQLTSDGGFVLAGDISTITANSSNILLIKTDSNGNAPETITR